MKRCDYCPSKNCTRVGMQGARVRWRCNVCFQNFLSQYLAEEGQYGKCKYCPSKFIFRAGKKNGFQRYMCGVCLVSFKAEPRVDNVKHSKAGECKHCQSVLCVKCGTLNGYQRWKCKDCKRSFTTNIVPIKAKHGECKYCQSIALRKAGTPNGCQVYKCNTCLRYQRKEYLSRKGIIRSKIPLGNKKLIYSVLTHFIRTLAIFLNIRHGVHCLRIGKICNVSGQTVWCWIQKAKMTHSKLIK